MKWALLGGAAVSFLSGLVLAFWHGPILERLRWEVPSAAWISLVSGLLIASIGAALWLIALRPNNSRSLLWLTCTVQVLLVGSITYGIADDELPSWFGLLALIQAALLMVLVSLDRSLAAAGAASHNDRNALPLRLGQSIVVGAVLAAAGWSAYHGFADLNRPDRTTSRLILTPVASKLPAIADKITPFTTAEAFPNLRFGDMTFVAPVPGGGKTLWVLERQGRIQMIEGYSTAREKTLVLDIVHLVGDVTQFGDDGLSGLAFHPEFAKADSPHRGEFFLHYTMHMEGKRALRLAKFTVPPGSSVADPKSEVILIEQPDENPSHNGGMVMFGPDGFLYFTVGDDDVRHPNKHAQYIDRDLFSGVLRVDPDCRGGDVSHPPKRQPNTGKTAHYFIPNDNPWVGVPNALEEFYAIGLRNPWRASFDRESGKLWVSDVGEHRREEVSVVEKGSNCGWSYLEGTVWSNSHSDRALDRPEPYLGKETMPIFEYERDAMNRCIIGGYVYRGKQFPDLVGKYVYADISGRIYGIEVDDQGNFVQNHLLAVMETDGHGITSFAEDADGELLICVIRDLNTETSEIHRLVRTEVNPSQQLPKLLSQTGLFTDMKDFTLAEGLVPFEVNTPLWSDRAAKYRWISLPKGKKITGEMKGPWEFPVGTILVKHFDLPLIERGVEEETAPTSANSDSKQEEDKSLRRLETRVLVRDDNGGYYAATYRWNAEETEAYLIDHSETEDIDYCDAHGHDQQQTWLYPGRFECMVCHNPQANFVLGFTAKQLNRDIVVDGHKVNQLQRFIDAGMFDSKIKKVPVKKAPKLAALDDPHATPEHKVRSYLDSNCSHCHRPGRYAGRWDARFEKPLDKQRIVDGVAIFHAFIDADAKVVKPGDSAHSYMFKRITSNDPHMRMPPLGRNVVHDDAVAVIKQWIDSLPPSVEAVADKKSDTKTR